MGYYNAQCLTCIACGGLFVAERGPAAGENTDASPAYRVAMLGAFPPQTQGIPFYTGLLLEGLAHHCAITALGFRRMYPTFLFRGVKRSLDASATVPVHARLRICHPLTWYNPIGWLYYAFTVPCDVFHAQWWSAPLFPVTWLFCLIMRIRRKPVVLTLHNIEMHETWRGYRLFIRLLGALSHAIIVHEAGQAAIVCRRFPQWRERVHVIPHPAPCDVKAEPRVERAQAAQALGLNPERRYVLFFGIIRPYKGVDVLLRAMADIAAEFPDTDLLLAGKPWEDEREYVTFAEELGLKNRVHFFLDYIPAERVGLFFTLADLVMLPYRHFEAQSGVGALALGYRKPMVVTRVGALPEWVGGDPEWIVPPGDEKALAACLRRFLRNASAETAAFQDIAERILAETSPEAVGARHAALYNALLQVKAAHR